MKKAAKKTDKELQDDKRKAMKAAVAKKAARGK